MNCPACGQRDTEVLETRRSLVGNEVQRRHECGCGVRWLSVQRMVRGSLVSLQSLPVDYRATTGRAPVDAREVSVSPLDPPSDPGSDPIYPDLSKPNSQRLLSIMGAAETPVMTFPVDGQARKYDVPAKLLAIHSQAFPSLDVLGEYRKALAFIESNPEKRKTARGMPQFLFRWLARVQDSGRANGHSKSQAGRRSLDALARERMK